MKKAVLSFIFSVCLVSQGFATSFTGVYSCSSGNNNDKPITYVFNDKLMLRDNFKSSPFEYVGSLEGGELLYVGYVADKERYQSIVKYSLPINVSDLGDYLDRRIGTRPAYHKSASKDPYAPKTKNEYVLHIALSCDERVSKGRLGSLSGLDETKMILRHLEKTDDNPLDISNAQNCEWANKYAKSQGIDDIVEYFISRHKQDAWNATKIATSITISPSQAKIWEAGIMQVYNQTKVYNCTVLQLDVPEISPPTKPITNEKAA